MYQTANNIGVVGLRTASSGISEAYRFQAKNSQLKDTAAVATKYEQALAKLFGIYNKTTVDYEVAYTKNFDVFYDQLSSDDYTKLLALDIKDEVKTEIKNTIVNKYLNHLSLEEQTKLKDL
jgi:hypothetical protein